MHVHIYIKFDKDRIMSLIIIWKILIYTKTFHVKHITYMHI